MADSVSDVVVPAATWTDLYAGSGITVGTAVSVYNKGLYSCQLVRKATVPASLYGVPLYSGAVGSSVAVPASASGLWAYSDSGTLISIQA